MKNSTLYRFSFIPIFLVSFLAIAQIGGGGGIGGFPTRDYTLSGTLEAEQITSTDDIDYNGVLTNDFADNTTFAEYLRFQTSDFATDGSAFYIQKSSVEDDWLLGTSLTGGGGIRLRFDADLNSLNTDNSFLSTTTITGEQLTSTDDIDYNGVLTNNYLNNTTFGDYISFETSDYGSNGSAFFVQKSAISYSWLIGAQDTAGNYNAIRFTADTKTIELGDDASTTITANSVDITPTEGSYTGSWTGCTTSPTSTIYYRRSGNQLILTITGLGPGCTSNASTFTITGAPSAIRPSGSTSNCELTGVDNGSIVETHVDLNLSGVLTFRKGNGSGAYSSSGWTSSGTKGVGQATNVTCSMLYVGAL